MKKNFKQKGVKVVEYCWNCEGKAFCANKNDRGQKNVDRRMISS